MDESSSIASEDTTPMHKQTFQIVRHYLDWSSFLPLIVSTEDFYNCFLALSNIQRKHMRIVGGKVAHDTSFFEPFGLKYSYFSSSYIL
jgi:hypothetical protein